MEFIPVAIQVLLSWLLMLVGTVGTYFKKKEEE